MAFLEVEALEVFQGKAHALSNTSSTVEKEESEEEYIKKTYFGVKMPDTKELVTNTKPLDFLECGGQVW